ncbi:MAG: PAS domain-containing sensor histidine kinase [Larkinella arboricola]
MTAYWSCMPPNMFTFYLIQSWNQAAHRLLGYSPQQAREHPFSLLYPPGEVIPTKLEQALALDYFTEQTWLIRPDQSRFWARVTLTAVYTGEEQLAGFAVLIKDLTEQKQFEEARQAYQQYANQQNQLLAAIVEKSPAGIALFEPILNMEGQPIDFTYKLINQANAATLGLTIEQHFNQTLLTLFPQVKGNIFWMKLVGCYQTGQPQQLTGHFKALGFDMWIDGKFDKVGSDVLWTCLDISQLKKAQIELENQLNHLQAVKYRLDTDLGRLQLAEKEVVRALEREREMNTLKTEFVKLVSHQFRNPMASITLKAEALKRFSERSSDRAFAQKVAEYCEQVGRDIHRLDKLITEVLFNERLQAGQLEVRRQRLNLVAFCQHLIQQQQVENETYQRVVFSSEQSTALLWTDPILLEQVLDNLISNALKYSGGSETPVEVSLTQAPREYALMVKDYGIGIPADAVEHVCKSFYRAWNVTEYPGTGLGLSLSHRIVELLGGSLAIESQQNQYTLCTVRLPRQEVS